MPASEWRGDLAYQFIIQVSYDALNFYGEDEEVVDISISGGHCRRWHRRVEVVHVF